jgi:DNA-binding NtrC family response regulator
MSDRRSRPRILIVDPDVDASTALALHLERKGYCVSRRSFGIDALEQIAQSRPDLVVSAAEIPDCPGIEFLDAVERISPTTPVVVRYGRKLPAKLAARELLDEVQYLLNAVPL